MPRQARLDTPGALHHIMIRGINKSAIFADDQDKTMFLERLGQNIVGGKCSVYAWALMDSHVHLLFKSGQQRISSVMGKLLTWYAQYFNRRHGRTGHLFENRYKSILCDEDKYLLVLARYIHLNPVRANIVNTLGELDSYPWSGHSALMGKAKYDWMDTSHLLSQFGVRRQTARIAYRRFVGEGLGMGKKPELTGGGLIRSRGGWSQVVSIRRSSQREESDERILGNGDFVSVILKEVEEKTKRQLKILQTGKTLGQIIEEECQKEGTSGAELRRGSRRRRVSLVRGRIAKRGMEEMGLTMAEIARHVGVSTSSIAKAIGRSEKRNEKDKVQ